MSIVRQTAIIPMTPGADHTDYEGYFVKLSGGNPILVAAASEVPFGIIIVGDVVAGQDSIGVCGGNLPTVRAKLSGAISKGQTMQLDSVTVGACIVDAGTGTRVVVATALEDGVSGDRIEAVILTPVKYS